MSKTTPAPTTTAEAHRSGVRHYWHIWWLLTSRNLRIRYSASALGYFWSVLDPLLMSLIYWFVFTAVFDRTVGEDPYIVFLLAGLLPWMWFNGAVSDSDRAFLKEAKLIRSIRIPRTIWINSIVLAKGIEFALSLPVLAVFAIFSGATVSWQIVYFIPAIMLQYVLTYGVGLLVAPLVTMFRDLDRAVKLLLRFMFYATPIVYAAGDLPGILPTIAAFNPLSGIFQLYREGFFPGTAQWDQIAISAAMSLVFLGIGLAVFRRSERTILKEI